MSEQKKSLNTRVISSAIFAAIIVALMMVPAIQDGDFAWGAYGYGGGYGGGGGGVFTYPFTTELCGSTDSWIVSDTGVMQNNASASCSDGNTSIYIPAGVTLLNSDGVMLSGLTMEYLTPLPAAPDGYHMLAAFNFEPDGATFDPGIQLTVKFDPALLPEGFSGENLVLGIYDDVAGTWTYITGTVDLVNNTITFTITHFSILALMAAPAPATPTPTATATATSVPTQTVAPTPTVTATPTAVPTIPSGGGTSGKSEMPDRWVLIVLIAVGATLLAVLVGAIIRRARA